MTERLLFVQLAFSRVRDGSSTSASKRFHKSGLWPHLWPNIHHHGHVAPCPD